MSGDYRNADVIKTDTDSTLHARRFAVVAEFSEDNFETWWEDVLVTRCHTETEALEFARRINGELE